MKVKRSISKTYCIISFLLLLIFVSLQNQALSRPPASEPNAVSVSIKIEQPIRLVRYCYTGDPEYDSSPALDGSFSVCIVNNSKQSIEFWEPLTHGLIFVNVKTGGKYVIIHSCQCVKDVREPDSFTVESGATYRFNLFEWRCDSIWEPPPPGEYMVTYRILPIKLFRHIVNKEVSTSSSQGLMRQFRILFTEDRFWEGGFSSKSIRIKLREPIEIPMEAEE